MSSSVYIMTGPGLALNILFQHVLWHLQDVIHTHVFSGTEPRPRTTSLYKTNHTFSQTLAHLETTLGKCETLNTGQQQ